MKASVDHLGRNTDGTFQVVENTVFTPSDAQTKYELNIFHGTTPTGQVERFKQGIKHLVRAVKFAEYSEE